MIEQKTTYGGLNSELVVYKTVKRKNDVKLELPNLMLALMLSGKKIISVAGAEAFEFKKDEVLVVAPGETAVIDMPDADVNTARCISLEISRDKLSEVIEKMNTELPRSSESGEWSLSDTCFSRLPLTPGLSQAFRNMTGLFVEDLPFKDTLIDNHINSLIIRLLHTGVRHHLLELYDQKAINSGLSNAIRYIRKNLHRRVTIEELAKVAFMSKANLYRYFKNELGTNPGVFIAHERIILAKKLLEVRNNSVTEVCFSLGFNSLSHFIQAFKSIVGATPKQFQKNIQHPRQEEVPSHS
ncbi:MAG: AraC family transcriptional regulator [Proteobacteria bacterium]|nr:AraC family transcriptional regulator [Pseudomonadota bacterium]